MVVSSLIYWCSLKLEGGNCMLLAEVDWTQGALFFWLFLVFCLSAATLRRLDSVQKKVDQILDNLNAGADTDASGSE